MTRFEATETLRKLWGFSIKDDNISPRWIDVFVQLGMLKLEEPKSARDKFIDAITNRVIGETSRGIVSQYVIGPNDAAWICSMAEHAGLQIVEK